MQDNMENLINAIKYGDIRFISKMFGTFSKFGKHGNI